MERELWLTLYRWILHHANLDPRRRGPKGVWYTDALVAAVWLWAVLHDRAVCWATQRCNWPDDLLHFELPSQSTMSRRLNNASFKQFLAELHQTLNRTRFGAQQTLVKVMDSKPLPVGAYSAAKDARWGQGSRCQQRGYKLHGLYGAGPLPIAFEVTPMNASEQRVARRLLRQLDGVQGYVLADSVYEVNTLYAIASMYGHQLLSPRKCPGKNVAADARHPSRLRSIDLLEGPFPAFGRALYGRRTEVERRFSLLCSGPGGFLCLPPFVRWLPNVNRWMSGKLLIAAARWQCRNKSYEVAA